MYKYQIWDSGCLLHEEEGFDTEEEALEEAHSELDERFMTWKFEGCYHGETYDDFDIRIGETEESEVF